MPLQPGNSRATISANISELTHHGSKPRAHKQIVAIALSNARKTGRKKAPGLSKPNGVRAAGVKMEPGAKIMHASGASGDDES